MKYRRRLRSRIIFSFLLFGTVLSGLFAVSVLLLQENLEDELVGNTLRQELDDFIVQYREDPTVVEPFHTRIEGFMVRPGDPNSIVNPVFRDLSTGVHKIETSGRVYRAAIRKDDDIWFFLTQDVSAAERLTEQLLISLIGIAGLFSLLSFALGVWSSRRVMKPVTDLADRLTHLDEDAPLEPLATYFADDEVGQLAVALDDYAERLKHLVERDHEFNADVSHELRTPLAVISGATELLLSQEDLPEKAHVRLLRIARAARQSTDITTALLHLVRAERGVTHESTAHSVAGIVEKLLKLYEPLLEGKPVELRCVEHDRVSVIAPEAVIAVTIGNLIGNAVRYTQSGTVTVHVGSGAVRVIDSGPGIPDEEIPHVFDRHFRGQTSTGKGSGLGLAIVKRLSILYNWEISVQNREGGGLIAEIRFFGAPARPESGVTQAVH